MGTCHTDAAALPTEIMKDLDQDLNPIIDYDYFLIYLDEFLWRFSIRKPWCLSLPEPCDHSGTVTHRTNVLAWSHRPCWEKENIISFFSLKRAIPWKFSVMCHSSMWRAQLRLGDVSVTWLAACEEVWVFLPHPNENISLKINHFGFVAVVLGFGFFSRVLVRIL